MCREGIVAVAARRAAYITPSHQFPLGVTMSATRRMQLLNWAVHSGAWIIEDDYDSEYRFGGRPIASLQGLDTDGRVIYVGTFSKVMFPALRLGYVVVPKIWCRPFRTPATAPTPFLHPVSGGHDRLHPRGAFRPAYTQDAHPIYGAARSAGGSHRETFEGRLEVIGAEAGCSSRPCCPAASTMWQWRGRPPKGVSARPLSTCYLKPAAPRRSHPWLRWRGRCSDP